MRYEGGESCEVTPPTDAPEEKFTVPSGNYAEESRTFTRGAEMVQRSATVTLACAPKVRTM